MKKKTLLPLLIGMAFLTGSCRKDVIDNLDANEGIVYMTEHDNTATFSNYERFRIADSVSVIRDGRLESRARTPYDSNLIAALTQAMVQRGFVLESDRTKTPDIGINVSRITSEYTGIVSYNDYWGGYGGYWDPFYWGYGGYDYFFPYTLGTYTYREGALSIDMLDLKNVDTATNRIKTVWTGLARGTGIFNSFNINEMVKALFDQSPYLQNQ